MQEGRTRFLQVGRRAVFWGRLAAAFRGSHGPAFWAGSCEGGCCCKTPHWGVFAGWLGAGRAGLIPSGSWPTATFFFSFKKKGAKPLRAKSCPFGAVALRDAAAAAEMRPPVRNGGVSPDLRAKSLATLGCAPKRACGRSATGDQGAALTPSPSGTWATPSPLKRAAPNFRPYGSLYRAKGCAWGLG